MKAELDEAVAVNKGHLPEELRNFDPRGGEAFVGRQRDGHGDPRSLRTRIRERRRGSRSPSALHRYPPQSAYHGGGYGWNAPSPAGPGSDHGMVNPENDFSNTATHRFQDNSHLPKGNAAPWDKWGGVEGDWTVPLEVDAEEGIGKRNAIESICAPTASNVKDVPKHRLSRKRIRR